MVGYPVNIIRPLLLAILEFLARGKDSVMANEMYMQLRVYRKLENGITRGNALNK